MAISEGYCKRRTDCPLSGEADIDRIDLVFDRAAPGHAGPQIGMLASRNVESRPTRSHASVPREVAHAPARPVVIGIPTSQTRG